MAEQKAVFVYQRNSILRICCKILAEIEKALSALSDIRISVSRQCFCAFRCFSRG